MQAAAPSVLTLEEDPTVRADLRLALEDAGFAVVAQTGDGAEAVELAREHRPDVVVLRTRDETSERILEDLSSRCRDRSRPPESSRP